VIRLSSSRSFVRRSHSHSYANATQHTHTGTVRTTAVFASERNTVHSHSLATLVLALRVLDLYTQSATVRLTLSAAPRFDLKNLRFAASAGTTAGDAGLDNNNDTAATTTIAVATVAKKDAGTAAALASVCEVSLVHLAHHSFVQSTRTIRNRAKHTLVIRGTRCPARRCAHAREHARTCNTRTRILRTAVVVV
jgi:hypothetical protein